MQFPEGLEDCTFDQESPLFLSDWDNWKFEMIPALFQLSFKKWEETFQNWIQVNVLIIIQAKLKITLILDQV